jgi:hypothetical protein
MEFEEVFLHLLFQLSSIGKIVCKPSYYRIENEKLSKPFFQIAFGLKSKK